MAFSRSILYHSPPTPLFTSFFILTAPFFKSEWMKCVCRSSRCRGGWPASKSRSPTADESVFTWRPIGRPTEPCLWRCYPKFHSLSARYHVIYREPKCHAFTNTGWVKQRNGGSLMFTAMATCHDPEGWKVISRLRDFDTTLCFEEGIILSGLLGLLLVSAMLRSLSLTLSDAMVRSSKSLWILRGKLVRVTLSLTRG